MSRHESPEVGAMTRRMVRALVRRTREGDTEALEELARLADLASDAVGVALEAASEFGYSTGHLAGVLGTSRQAVQQRQARAARSPHRDWLRKGADQ